MSSSYYSWQNKIVRIKNGWHEAGRQGLALAEPIYVSGQDWLPIKWDDEVDPDFHKLAGIEVVKHIDF